MAERIQHTPSSQHDPIHCTTEPIHEFCRMVSEPLIPSPACGSVIATVGAMLASLTELIARVSEKADDPFWKNAVEQAADLRERLLRFADEDIEEAARIIRGEADACIRKQIGVPAKIASHLVKILRLAETIADRIARPVLSDIRAVAHLGRGAAEAIFEIERDNIERAGGGDPILLRRIEEWRDEAIRAADSILEKTREFNG